MSKKKIDDLKNKIAEQNSCRKDNLMEQSADVIQNELDNVKCNIIEPQSKLDFKIEELDHITGLNQKHQLDILERDQEIHKITINAAKKKMM
jgi:hypothetical protein